MIETLLIIALILACFIVLGMSVDRVDTLKPRVNKWGWSFQYLLQGVGAIAVLVEFLEYRDNPRYSVWLLLSGVLLNLLLTHAQWKSKHAPPITDKCKPSPEEACDPQHTRPLT